MGLDQLFSFLLKPFEWLLGWCPHYNRLHVYEGGVKISGARVRTLKHGSYFWVPNLTEVHSDNIKRKTISLPDETQTTKDTVRIRIGGVLVYYITNVETWLIDNEDAEEAVLIAAARVLRDIVADSSFNELCEPAARRRSEDTITRTAQEILGQKYGIRVEHLGFTTLCQTEARDISHSGLSVPMLLSGDGDT